MTKPKRITRKNKGVAKNVEKQHRTLTKRRPRKSHKKKKTMKRIGGGDELVDYKYENRMPPSYHEKKNDLISKLERPLGADPAREVINYLGSDGQYQVGSVTKKGLRLRNEHFVDNYLNKLFVKVLKDVFAKSFYTVMGFKFYMYEKELVNYADDPLDPDSGIEPIYKFYHEHSNRELDAKDIRLDLEFYKNLRETQPTILTPHPDVQMSADGVGIHWGNLLYFSLGEIRKGQDYESRKRESDQIIIEGINKFFVDIEKSFDLRE